MKRDEHKKNRRKVEAFARLIEPPEMIYELEEDGSMRSLGLPARYVSGYIENEPPPGTAKLVGAASRRRETSDASATLGGGRMSVTAGAEG